METISVILTFGGLLVAIIASIGLLVVAFRVSVGWFIVCFLPFGKIVFAIVHWQEARGMVLTYLASVAVMFAGVAIGRNVDGSIFQTDKKNAGSPPTAASTALVTREVRITTLEAKIAKNTVDLNATYRDLSTRRAALKPGDGTALTEYNLAATRYAALLESTRKAKAELDALFANPN